MTIPEKDILYILRTGSRGKPSDARILRAADAVLRPSAEDPPLRVDRSEQGKPFFPDIPVHFSVTHSGEYWMCLFSRVPVGIDLQEHGKKNDVERIAHRFFHPEEVRFLEDKGWNRFYSVWCAKESYVKYTGSGIAGTFSTFSVVEGDDIKKEIEGIPLRERKEFPHYTMFICGGSDGDIETAEGAE